MFIKRILQWPARLRWSATGSYVLLLTWLLLAPASTFDHVGQLVDFQDKIAHGSLFLALGFLGHWSLAARDGRGWRRFGALAALALYAAGIEMLQPVLGGEGRQFDWLDMAFNFIGVGGGWLLFRLAGSSRL